MEKLLVVGTTRNISANEVWTACRNEGNVHVEVKGKYFHITSDWVVHLMRLHEALTGDSIGPLSFPCVINAR
jgi:hypothetical protein